MKKIWKMKIQRLCQLMKLYPIFLSAKLSKSQYCIIRYILLKDRVNTLPKYRQSLKLNHIIALIQILLKLLLQPSYLITQLKEF